MGNKLVSDTKDIRTNDASGVHGVALAPVLAERPRCAGTRPPRGIPCEAPVEAEVDGLFLCGLHAGEFWAEARADELEVAELHLSRWLRVAEEELCNGELAWRLQATREEVGAKMERAHEPRDRAHHHEGAGDARARPEKEGQALGGSWKRRRGRDTAWWLRAYAGTTGAVLIALGGTVLLLPLAPDPAVSLLWVSVGALFVYAGLGLRDPVVSRRFVGGMGVLLLLDVGTIVCARLLVGGGVFGAVQGTCLVVGIASLLVARRAEPGVLVAAASGFGTAVASVPASTLGAAVTATTARVRRRRVAPAIEPAARPTEKFRGKNRG